MDDVRRREGRLGPCGDVTGRRSQLVLSDEGPAGLSVAVGGGFPVGRRDRLIWETRDLLAALEQIGSNFARQIVDCLLRRRGWYGHGLVIERGWFPLPRPTSSFRQRFLCWTLAKASTAASPWDEADVRFARRLHFGPGMIYGRIWQHHGSYLPSRLLHRNLRAVIESAAVYVCVAGSGMFPRQVRTPKQYPRQHEGNNGNLMIIHRLPRGLLSQGLYNGDI